MIAPLTRIILYVKDIEAMVQFYETHFGFVSHRDPADRIVELRGSGASLMLHPAAKSQKMGQALVKLVFDVEDVEAFRARAAKEGLNFGKVHAGDGYVFANAKDPCSNSIQVSSRAFRG